jgi:predicted PhzF superfamily epimerase YddE/YHI9
MDFPAQAPTPCDTPAALVEAFPVAPTACLKAEDYILVFDDENSVREAMPDLSLLKTVDLRGVAITSKARDYDFVCRFFAPRYGIDEDPVTGSSFTQLIPYWSQVLGKTRLTAKQVSARGGEVHCELLGERVAIAGRAVSYMQATIEVPSSK